MTKDTEAGREIDFNLPPHMDPTFVEAWCKMEDEGYRYSEGNVAKVHLGWLMAHKFAHPPRPAPVDPDPDFREYVRKAGERLAPHSGDAPGTPTRDALVWINAALHPIARSYVPLDLPIAPNIQTAPVDPVAGGEALREGPAPIPNTRMQCFGCKHLDTKYWREPSGDGETFDSGTSARCKAIPTEHGGQSISAYWSRSDAAPKWCPFLAALKGPAA